MGRVTNASEDVFLVSKKINIKKKACWGDQEGKPATNGFVLAACDGMHHSVCPSISPAPRIEHFSFHLQHFQRGPEAPAIAIW